MPSLTNLSTEDLRKELEQREGALGGLLEKRDDLERELAELNNEIAAAGGQPKRKRGRPKGSKNKPKTDDSAPAAKSVAKTKTATKSPAAGRKRPKNDKPLPAVLADVLNGQKPMALDDIHEAVVETGYKTSSKNFKNVIYQNLYNKDEFTKTGDGWVYKP